MNDLVAEWILRLTPPELYPVLTWSARDFDEARPILILAFAAILFATIGLASLVWRIVR